MNLLEQNKDMVEIAAQMSRTIAAVGKRANLLRAQILFRTDPKAGP